MRNGLLLMLLLTIGSPLAHAWTPPPVIVCTDCRDPQDHPEDFINFGFNQIIGPNAWMTFGQADNFYVANLELQTVYIDVDFVFTGIGIQGLQLPLWPRYMLQFTIALPDGTVLTVIRSTNLAPLPVPASPPGPPEGGDDTSSSGDAGAGGDDGDEEDGDYADADDTEWEEPETDDPAGIVDIEDPDENGDFDDTEWCEEC